MEEIKKVGVLSLARITTLFGVLIGLFGYLLMWGVARFAGNVVPGLAQVPFSIRALLSAVVIYAFMYFVVGILVALLYNLFAKWIGGVKLELGATKARKK